MAEQQNENINVVQAAGDINIQEFVLITTNGQEIDISAHLGEFNLFEDMFRTGLYGNVLIIDNLNLSQTFGLSGDEYLRVKMSTPSMPAQFYKTFKIYSITDRIMLNDTGRQSYIMHFCSPELFMDSLSPVYKTFSGKITDVAEQLFKYVSVSRTGTGSDYTTMYVVGNTLNDIKFTSPGWTPMRCLTWLASKTQGVGFNSPGYVFFESNKAFYFVNVEQIIDAAVRNKKYYQDYFYVANNLTDDADNNSQYVKNITKEYQKAEDMKVITTFNGLKNTQNGYLANRLFTFDMVTKAHVDYDYDHPSEYSKYSHLENIAGKAVAPFPGGAFPSGALRSPAGFNQVYIKHKHLYTGFGNNHGDKVQDIAPRRLSAMNELTNFKIEITVPGRTDIEVGAIVKFHYPDASPRDATDKNLPKFDDLYSGFYLVTAIRHKITLLKHMMILELVKDSYSAQGQS